jgi:CBS domain-containing protein
MMRSGFPYGAEAAMLENVKVSEWMTSPVISISPETPISHAHQMMKEYGIRRLPVVEHNHLVGIVTLGDIREASPSDATTLSIWELNYLWAQLTVERVMTRHVLTLSPDASILDAAEVMLHKKVSGLPVVDAHGHLVGILTESDIFKMLVETRARAASKLP